MLNHCSAFPTVNNVVYIVEKLKAINIWPCSFFFILSKVTMRSCSPISSDVENKVKKSSNVSPSALEVQKLYNFRMPLPSSKIFGQQKGSYFSHIITITLPLYCPKRTWMQIRTFAGLKSEKMIPNSWMCFSPLTKSHPNFLTTSSGRHPSLPITDSREPPDWKMNRGGKKEAREQCNVLSSIVLWLIRQTRIEGYLLFVNSRWCITVDQGCQKYLLTCTELHYQPKVVTCLIPLIEAHYVWMIHIMAKTYLTTDRNRASENVSIRHKSKITVTRHLDIVFLMTE